MLFRSKEEADSQIAMFDVNGLLVKSRMDLSPSQIIYAKDMAETKDLVQAIDSFKPNILIGVSTVGKAFTQDVIEAMCKYNERPVIFALSNPTEHAECNATEAYTWSKGKAVFAGGIPYDPVEYEGKTFYPGQANNYYCFPGLSLAVYATHPKLITDAFWLEACKALADMLTPDEKEKGMVFPPQKDILEISYNIAVRVAKVAFDSGLATVGRPQDIAEWIKGMVYKPEYDK